MDTNQYKALNTLGKASQCKSHTESNTTKVIPKREPERKASITNFTRKDYPEKRIKSYIGNSRITARERRGVS